MKKIGIISDTHGTIKSRLFDFFKDVDEIWHAGDIGNVEILSRLQKFKPVRAVYGNIDDYKTRQLTTEFQNFKCENAKIIMTHIGGYPGRYNPKALKIIKKERPHLFISGHSHILKVIHDKQNNLLHINPGAAGNDGFHKNITMIRFEVEDERFSNLEILDIER